jgi:guanylate kinase
MFLVICAPSGAGKTTVIKEILKIFPFFKFSVSATTRKIRKGEQNGKDYYFITRQDFEQKIKNNELVEWEIVYGDYYGTLKSEIDKSLSDGLDLILEVEVLGAVSIKKLYPEAVTVFIDAPKNELIERLKKRNTESDKELSKRIERMEMEFGMKSRFDYVIKNETGTEGVNKSVEQLKKILKKYINN